MTPSRPSRPGPGSPAIEQLERRHRAILREIAQTGLVLRGTIGRYRTRCGSPRCPCAADRVARHGPYFIWTRKVGGRTVTRMLSAEQAARLRPWTRNMRRLDRLLKKLQELGLRASQALPRS